MVEQIEIRLLSLACHKRSLQIIGGLFAMIIFGDRVVEPGESKSNQIELLTTNPDHYYQDGTVEVQYAYWALIDKEYNLIDGQKNGIEVDGSYIVKRHLKSYAVIEEQREEVRYLKGLEGIKVDGYGMLSTEGNAKSLLEPLFIKIRDLEDEIKLLKK